MFYSQCYTVKDDRDFHKLISQLLAKCEAAIMNSIPLCKKKKNKVSFRQCHECRGKKSLTSMPREFYQWRSHGSRRAQLKSHSLAFSNLRFLERIL